MKTLYEYEDWKQALIAKLLPIIMKYDPTADREEVAEALDDFINKNLGDG